MKLMPNSLIKKRLTYFRNCYQADSRELNLDRIGLLPASSSPELIHFFPKEEFLARGTLPSAPLSPDVGNAIDTNTQLYAREVHLLYGLFFVSGGLAQSDETLEEDESDHEEIEGLEGIKEKQKTDRARKNPFRHADHHIVSSPVLYYEAFHEIDPSDQSCLLHIDLAQPVLNRRLLRRILKGSDYTIIDSAPLPRPYVDDVYLADLLRWLEQHCIIDDVLPAAMFPKLDASVQKNSRKKQNHETPPYLSLHASAAIMMVKRGATSRGIAHELLQLAQQDEYSQALCQLLADEKPIEGKVALNGRTALAQTMPYALPALLSAAQTQALENAAHEPLSFISGPPGTGKSYTLAALALDRCLNNESVLIVTRTEQAATVLANKLRDDMGMTQGIVNLGESKSLLVALKKQLTALLAGRLPKATLQDVHACKSHLTQLVEEEKRLQKQFKKRGRYALQISQMLAKHHKGALPWWQQFVRVPLARWAIGRSMKHWHILEQLNQCQEQREQISAQYLNTHRASTLHALLSENRDVLVNYRNALMQQRFDMQSAYFDKIDLRLLLKALPIWIVTLDDLHRTLPFKHEIFDLLIVDEATQCDIPSVLPALQRCKRAVISGDSQQLRHISFLSRPQELRLFKQAGLPAQDQMLWSYRDNSLLDLVGQRIKNQNAITALDEHFRSRPELIRFSNARFYNNQIRVMKERPEVEGENSTRQPALVLERMQGVRSAGKSNDAEVKRIMQLVKQHMQKYQFSPKKPSLGILSPFRAQVDAVRRIVLLELTRAQIAEFNILVATPYGFQGEERDIMILSFAIDDESRQASNYLNRADVFNVAITRAREQQYVLFSGSEKNLPAQNLLRYYLQDLEQGCSPVLPDTAQISSFQENIVAELAAHDVKTWVHFPVAGQLIDLICYRNGHTLAIDLIGYPGLGECFMEMDRYQVLARAGLEMLPLSYGVWSVDKESAVQAILDRL